MAIEKMQTRVGEIFVIRPDDDPETAYVRAAVGTLEGLAHPAHFLRDALAGNRFGLETNGGTLSLGEDAAGTVYLTQRTAADVDEAAAREAVLQGFAGTLLRWRERLALEEKAPADEATEEKEVR